MARNGGPSLPVTRISRYLTGEENCLYKLWRLAREPVSAHDGPAIEAIMAHAAAVRDLAQTLSDGRLESELWLEFHTPRIVGKADLVQQVDGQTVVWEVKTGRRKPSHVAQVLLYLWLLRETKMTRGVIRGAITYPPGPDNVVAVDESLVGAIRQPMTNLLRAVHQQRPGPKIVGSECRWCPLRDCEYNPHSTKVDSTAAVTTSTTHAELVN